MVIRLSTVKKINFLLIGIEAVSMYALDEYCKDKNNNFFLQKLSVIRYSSNLDWLSNNLCNHKKKEIEIIGYVQNLVNNFKIQSTICNILRDMGNEKVSKITYQYLDRFSYIYFRTQNYYDGNNKRCNAKYMHEVAKLNLYMMHRITYQDGIYFFVKYLYSK